MKKGPLPLKSESKSKKQMFTKEKLEKLLQHYFGYSGFRGKQLEAIEAVLSGTDCFCLMPTGGGKSMCYQIPALAKPGIVLVISPLIALMENQVATLKKKGIPADFLSSTQDTQTKKKIHEDLDSGKPSVKLLYATPELLATVQFMTKLKKLYNRGLLSLIAIDEAHCISTWGHDFRPSYRKLSSLRSHLQDVPILALTATAVPKVEKDVIESLDLQRPTILRASFNRANIFYEVRYKDLLDNVYNDIANLLKSSGNVCSIIYCLERSTCDDLSDHLSKNGISSAAYHAGLNNKMRSIVLDDWLSSRIQVVVATVAFGMGIDRQDVRIVCHYNIPKSMEAFYQESGRAGRDQLPARSVLYYGLQDRSRMEFILCNADSKKSKSSCSSGSTSKKALTDFNQMTEYCLGSGCRRKKILDCFGEQVTASFCQKSCDACKHPNLVSTRLGELKCVPQFNKKDGVAPIFMKSSLAAPFGGIDCEFWNRDDEADFSDGDISASDDEEDGLSSLARSTMASKSRLGEKFKALEHAEEIYFQNKVLKKGGGLSDKKVISETVREASKKRLLNALNQAQVRLGNQLSAVEDSAAFLEMECFTKYEKVGKTFYNSQIAATIRWLSSSDYEQISGRFRTSSFVATSQSRQDYLSNEAPSSLPGSANSVEMQFETSNKEAHNVIPPDLPSNSLQTSPAIANSNNRQDHLPNAASSSLQRMQLETNNKEARDFFLQDSPCNSLRNKEACDVILLDSPCKSVQEGDKIELPPIPSFSVFANKKGKERQKDYAKVKSQNHSRGFQKRPEEFEPHERKSPKKFRPR